MILRWLSPLSCLLLGVALSLWFHTYPLALGLMLLPLLLALPGLLHGKRYTAAWVSLLTLPYLALGMTEAIVTPAARGHAYAVMLCAAVLFVSVVLYVRTTRAISTSTSGTDSAQP